jgi:integrase
MPKRVQAHAVAKKDKQGRKKYYARIRWKNPDGSPGEMSRVGGTRAKAKALADKLAAKMKHGGVAAIDAEDMTFEELATQYCASEVIDPIYDGQIKVRGMKAKRQAQNEVNALTRYWKATRIQEITHTDLSTYLVKRLKEPTRSGGQRKMSSVNHDLRRMRAMLNFAKRNGWILTNPFNQGAPLISEAVEIPRDRGRQDGELERILAQCVGRRAHMRAFILCLVDTALRPGEARRVLPGDIDLERMIIIARPSTTKSNRSRAVPLTDRVAAELAVLLKDAKPDRPIFDVGESNKTAWKRICRDAGVEGLQLRDLRHWGATQIAGALAAAGLPWQHGMAATGHTQIKTYLRYINKDEIIAQQTGGALRDALKKENLLENSPGNAPDLARSAQIGNNQKQ